jgi:glycosyltransferase involved in cell wall biosynthesis
MPEASTDPQPSCELSIVMPCLNEAETLEVCIHKALEFLEAHEIEGEVVIADNGSTDGSPEIAAAAGARVVHVPEKGYGSALMGGIAAARGVYCIMGDADDSYDFTNLMPFVEKLREGYDLVMGNRFKGGIAPGAMPPLHKYLGNPVLTGVGRLFFSSACGDFHCGLRGFRKDAVLALDLQTTGMEFASEMVVKATLLGQRVTEVATTLSPDGRSRPPHLRSWRDGWRHLRFLLLYSPRWLFLYPGFALIVAGTLVLTWLLPGPRVVGDFALNVNTMLYAATAILVGFQSVLFAVFTRIYGINVGLLPMAPKLERLFNYIRLETGLVIGGLLTALGVLGTLIALRGWVEVSFGTVDPTRVQRLVIPSMLALALGLQTVLASFFLSVLGLRRRGTRLPE